jgi:hypothetical protein
VQEAFMSDELKGRMSIWVDQKDRDNMAAIRRVYGIASDSAAIRFAVQRIAREIEAAELKRVRQGG